MQQLVKMDFIYLLVDVLNV